MQVVDIGVGERVDPVAEHDDAERLVRPGERHVGSRLHPELLRRLTRVGERRVGDRRLVVESKLDAIAKHVGERRGFAVCACAGQTVGVAEVHAHIITVANEDRTAVCGRHVDRVPGDLEEQRLDVAPCCGDGPKHPSQRSLPTLGGGERRLFAGLRRVSHVASSSGARCTR